MADDAQPDAPANSVTFTVKSSNDAKYVVTVPESMTVLDLKNKLAGSDHADVPADRQRLIYSGRVLKDPDPLANYKIKDGNTVHMVKSAASTQRQQQSNQPVPGAGSASAVPQNLAAGTGNDPLAGLTGARYAGFAQMPSADSFGPDGGMSPPNPEDLARQLENPMFAQQMNEAMDNPQVQQMMLNHPMMRDNPMMREILRNPEMRRMMFDPNMIRQSMRMQQQMRGTGMGGMGGMGGGGESMPAPGATDTTPQPDGGHQTQNAGATNTQQQQQANPFSALFGGGGAPGANSSPFGAGGNRQGPNLGDLLASMQPPNTGGTQAPNNASSDTTRSATDSTNAPQNPFANILGGGAGAGNNGQDPFAAAMQSLQQNPEMARNLMNMMGMGGGGAGAGGAGGAGGVDPFAMFGGMGGGGGGAPAQQDTRPPEEQYAEQLRQLNDMGFYDFEQNVRALRRAGGNVHGAVEMLLGGGA